MCIAGNYVMSDTNGFVPVRELVHIVSGRIFKCLQSLGSDITLGYPRTHKNVLTIIAVLAHAGVAELYADFNGTLFRNSGQLAGLLKRG